MPKKFTGNLVGDRADMTVMTWIEYDLQEVDETWQLTPTTLTINNDVFTAASCDDPTVADYFIGPDGLDGETLLAELPPRPTGRVCSRHPPDEVRKFRGAGAIAMSTPLALRGGKA